jgi:hypothetical protein
MMMVYEGIILIGRGGLEGKDCCERRLGLGEVREGMGGVGGDWVL